MSKNTSITCADGTSLRATVYQPQGLIKGAIMIAPATGIKRRFYASFAQHLCAHGYAAITYDNRGINDSLQGHPKDSDADLLAWGQLDMPAALTTLQTQFPNTQYHLVGHSAGGQLVGLMHNADALSSMFNYACSSGWLRNFTYPYKFKAHFFMNIFIPFSNFMFGHTKSQWVGMGEPLPSQVAQQWREWCNHGGYVKAVLGKTVHAHLYDTLNIPSMWVNSSDDLIAVDENVDDMLSVYKQLPAERLRLNPKDHNLSSIGHMDFFRSPSKSLWQYALDWFDRH